MSATSSQDQINSQYGKQIKDLRRQLEEGNACHEKLVGALEERIEESARKINVGNFSVQHENDFRADIAKLRRKLANVTKEHGARTDELEKRITLFEKRVNEAEKSSNIQGWISAFLYALASCGSSFVLSEESYDFGGSTLNSDEFQSEMKSLHKELQSVKASNKKTMEKIDRKLSGIENKIAREGSLLRYIAPTFYGVSAAFTFFRSMQGQLQHQFLPVMIEMGLLSFPGIISYLSKS